MMDWREFYLQAVYPHLEIPMADKYPLVSLTEREGKRLLGNHALLMLVALTGTGKSTTLRLLREEIGDSGAGVIPSRREVADWIAIPTAQALAGERIEPARDRVRRFEYTRFFAEQVQGGMAAAFSWLNLADDFDGLLFSEGIRGESEIRYALEKFPRWQIVELTLNPLTRLRRLSGRSEEFDRAGGTADLSFLPNEWQAEAEALFNAGEISAKALAIVRAEAASYGFNPFANTEAYASYHRVNVDCCTPNEVAAAVVGILDRRKNAICRPS